MTNTELFGGITWHLECMTLAWTQIDDFRPPADGFQMRMHYSIYLTNLMSALDMACEAFGNTFQTTLEESLSVPDLAGSEIYGYIRELRNGVVHRGVDPTSAGTVIDGKVCAIAPLTVSNRSGERIYSAPAHLLRDIYIHCEARLLPVVEAWLEPAFETLATVTPEAMLNEALTAIEETAHMPDWAKQMARENLGAQVLQDAQAFHIQKLRGLLKPRSINVGN